MSVDAAPLIVSALFGAEDFAWLDGLRRAHFPPTRNQLSAHLTMFHHLPPSVEEELRHRLTTMARTNVRPRAVIAAVMNLGRGVALRIDSPDLENRRRDLAEAFAGLLTPQDAAGWRPHVTIQNKVTPEAARTLREALEIDFRPRPLIIIGLAIWRYRGGPWDAVSRHIFIGQ